MQLDDLADLVADLPETLTREVLRSLDQQDRERLAQVMAYDEDCAGGLMNVDIVTVRADVTLEVVVRYLRARGEMPDGTDSIFVVDRNGRYQGALLLSRLLTRDGELKVADVMSPEIVPIPAYTDRRYRSCGSSRIATCFPRPSLTMKTAWSVALRSTT